MSEFETVELTSSKGVTMQLQQSLASLLSALPGRLETREQAGKYQYIVYIVAVKAGTQAAKYDFYVGNTAKSARERLAEHREGGDMAARIFRDGKNVPDALCADLIPHDIAFRDRASAERAEGFVADHLAQHQLRVHSDRMSTCRIA